jgi:hypothetical protein
LGLPCSLPGLGRCRLTFEGFRGLRAEGVPKDISASASVAFAPVQSSCTARVR